MLEDSLFESRKHRETRNPLTVVISVAAHAVTIAVLLLIPLLQTQGITLQPIDLSLWAPVAETPPSVPVVSAQPHVQTQVQPPPNVLTAPQAIPQQIAIVNEPSTSFNLLPSSGGPGIGSVLVDLIGRQREADEEVRTASPPPTPPPPPPTVKTGPVRIGGDVQQGKLIHLIKPVYPQPARIARIQGTVQLDAVITKEGTVQSLRVIAGHPFLIQTALDAVEQWRYAPTLLNGEPVEVSTTINVTFTFR